MAQAIRLRIGFQERAPMGKLPHCKDRGHKRFAALSPIGFSFTNGATMAVNL